MSNVSRTNKDDAAGGKITPQNVEAERSLLGAIIQDSSIFPDILEKLSIQDFYDKRHALIYGAMKRLSDHNQPIDLLTVTSELRNQKILKDIGEQLKKGKDLQTAIQEAVASGHGIGKSALISWLIHFAISTHENTRGVVTANTEGQLRTKTWPELSKWHNMFIAKDLFTYTATAIFSSDKDYKNMAY